MDLINSLKACSIFKNLTSQDITYIIQKLNYKVKEFDKGETVYFRGDDVSHIIINIVGELYTEMQKYNGDVIEVGIIKQNDVLASAFIFAPFWYPILDANIKSSNSFFVGLLLVT